MCKISVLSKYCQKTAFFLSVSLLVKGKIIKVKYHVNE